jgi:predicted amidophosphoribosyltransferase
VPYCHSCKSEYTESVAMCAECGASLSAEPPPVDGNADIKLEKVYLAQGEMDAQMIRSVLEANGVECMLSGESVRLTHGFTVDGLAEVRVLVRETDAARARDVIAASEHVGDCPGCGEPIPADAAVCRQCARVIERPA